MNVYVESNFVLQLALLQEQRVSCEEILRLCEGGRIRLFLPAYSLIEPYETLVRRKKERQRIERDLNTELDQIARTEEHKRQLDGFRDITALLIRAIDEDTKRLNAIRSRLLESACVIPMDASILCAAQESEREQNLSPQDAHIYSAVVGHLKQTQGLASCFLNKNRRDFDYQDIYDQLKNFGCKLLPSFDKGREYVLNAVG